jgi:hypothetical protein
MRNRIIAEVGRGALGHGTLTFFPVADTPIRWHPYTSPLYCAQPQAAVNATDLGQPAGSHLS